MVYNRILDVVNNGNKNVVLFLAGNNTENVDGEEMSKEQVQQKISRVRGLVGYFEVSSEKGDGINDLFQTAIKAWLQKKLNVNNADEVDPTTAMRDPAFNKKTRRKHRCILQ